MVGADVIRPARKVFSHHSEQKWLFQDLHEDYETEVKKSFFFNKREPAVLSIETEQKTIFQFARTSGNVQTKDYRS